MIICTVAAANHLAFAKVLAKSVKDHIHHCKFVLCLIEEEIHPDAKEFECFDHIVLAKTLNVPNFHNFILKYSIYESACALKPHLLKYAFNYYEKETKFIYLDSDIRVYGSFDEVNELLDQYSIVLTPHRAEPQDILNSIDEEMVNLKDGVYQAGFLGLRKTDESLRFITWWAARCNDYSYIDYSRGLFLDQKWLNLVPCFFNDVYILHDPGYNMASWNLSQRKLNRWENKYMVNGRPLHFFHFSGLGKWLDNSLQLHVPDKFNIIYNLVDDYNTAYKKLGHYKYIDLPWSYERIMRYEAKDTPTVTETEHIKEEKIEDTGEESKPLDVPLKKEVKDILIAAQEKDTVWTKFKKALQIDTKDI